VALVAEGLAVLTTSLARLEQQIPEAAAAPVRGGQALVKQVTVAQAALA
jgi:hypothetical protein